MEKCMYCKKEMQELNEDYIFCDNNKCPFMDNKEENPQGYRYIELKDTTF